MDRGTPRNPRQILLQKYDGTFGTNRYAERVYPFEERLLREITTQVRGSTDPHAIMRTAVRELSTALGRPAFVRLGEASSVKEDVAGPEPSGEGGE